MGESDHESGAVLGPSGGVIKLYSLHATFVHVLLVMVSLNMFPQKSHEKSLVRHPYQLAFWGESLEKFISVRRVGGGWWVVGDLDFSV